MTWTTMIRFAPLTTLERLNDPMWARPGRTMYDPQSLTFLPHRTNGVPLLVNHDPERPIGTVRKLMRFEDVDGPWLVAVATVSDKPDWLKRDTRASFGYKLGRTSSFDRSDVLRKGYVTEVSVLTAGHEPLEPGARVLLLRENPTPILPEPSPAPAGVQPSVAPAGDTVVFTPPGAVLRRPCGQITAVY